MLSCSSSLSYDYTHARARAHTAPVSAPAAVDAHQKQYTHFRRCGRAAAVRVCCRSALLHTCACSWKYVSRVFPRFLMSGRGTSNTRTKRTARTSPRTTYRNNAGQDFFRNRWVGENARGHGSTCTVIDVHIRRRPRSAQNPMTTKAGFFYRLTRCVALANRTRPGV